MQCTQKAQNGDGDGEDDDCGSNNNDVDDDCVLFHCIVAPGSLAAAEGDVIVDVAKQLFGLMGQTPQDARVHDACTLLAAWS